MRWTELKLRRMWLSPSYARSTGCCLGHAFSREWFPDYGFVNQSKTEIQQNGLCKSSSSTQDVSPNHLKYSGDHSFNHQDSSREIGANHLNSSDDDCIIVKVSITRIPMLETVIGYYLHPFYSSVSKNSSDDTLSVSSVISIPQKSSNSSRSSASEDFHFNIQT